MVERDRGSPRYLIGTELYPHWARTIRLVASIVVPLVAAASLVAGLMADKGALEIVASTLWTVVVAFVSVAFWCTFGFAVAERTGQPSATRSWTPEDREPAPADSRPGVGETIGSVALSATDRDDLAELSGWVTASIVIIVAVVDSIESITGWWRHRRHLVTSRHSP